MEQNEFERRFIQTTELRVVPQAGARPSRLEGYAVVFNSPSENLGGFREIIAPGAFSQTLASGEDVRALRNHDDGQLLGRTSSNTLRLSQDDHGLKFSLDIPDTSYARDMIALLNRGDIRGMSFGFRVAKGDDKWGKDGSGGALRTVNKAKLGEVSVVDNPAYTQTSVSMRSKIAAGQSDMLRRKAVILDLETFEPRTEIPLVHDYAARSKRLDRIGMMEAEMAIARRPRMDSI
jgi:hypothetical protein